MEYQAQWFAANSCKHQQSGHECPCYIGVNDYSEPTSVLEVDDRFSPPVEYIPPLQRDPPMLLLSDPPRPPLQIMGPVNLGSETTTSLDFSILEEYGTSWQADGLQEIDAELWLDADEQLLLAPSNIQSTSSSTECEHNCADYSISRDTIGRSLAPLITSNVPDLLDIFHSMVDGRNLVPSAAGKIPDLVVEDDIVSNFFNHSEERPSLEEEYESHNSSQIKEDIKPRLSNSQSMEGTLLCSKRPAPNNSLTSTAAKRVHSMPLGCMVSVPAKSMAAAHAELATPSMASSIIMLESELSSIDVGLSDEVTTFQQATPSQNPEHGLELVHLLLACAEAVAWRDSSLATSLLEQLSTAASYTGDSIERVICCFVEGLSLRLASMCGSLSAPRPPRTERKEGLLQLYQSSPYLAFGFFAANEAILQAFKNKHHLHILDLGMMMKVQWPVLIRTLASRREGAPSTLRITAMAVEGLTTQEEIAEWGQELKDYANTQQIQLEFQALPENLDISIIESSMLAAGYRDALAINSVIQLHRIVKENRGSLTRMLQTLHSLNPAVMTLVEQDASHNGPFFLGRFFESLHYYSAIFDSLEANLPCDSQQRMKVERLHYAEEIKNIVACEGMDRVERHERGDQWRRHMGRGGFQSVPLKFLSKARMILSLYSSDGYTLAEEKGGLILGWKSKRILHASAWRCSSLSSPIKLAEKEAMLSKLRKQGY